MTSNPALSREKQILAVASGKGGVGKTVMTANLALSLAQQFSTKVIAVDLDLGCGNLNSCLGVRHPGRSINDFLFRRVKTLEELLVATPVNNLKLISCSYGGEMVQLNAQMKQDLLREVRSLDADLVLLDLGSGTSCDVLDFYSAADVKLVVTTPESLSLHNAFVFLKSAIYRSLWKELEGREFLAPLATKLRQIVTKNGLLTLAQVVEELRRWDRYCSYIVSGILEDLKIKLIFNQKRGATEEKYLLNFWSLLRKYLYFKGNLEYLGSVEFEEKVRNSTQSLRPFLIDFAKTRAAQDIHEISQKLMSRPGAELEEPGLNYGTRNRR